MRLVPLVLAMLLTSAAHADEGKYEGKTFAQWIEALRAGTDSRVQVAKALSSFEHRTKFVGFQDPPLRLPKDAARHVPILLAVLKTETRDPVRRDLVGTLGEIGVPAVVPTLAAALSDSDALVRWIAAEGLAKVGPAALSAVPALIHGLGSTDHRLRRECADALDAIGIQAAPKATPALRGLLDDPVVQVRAAALGALATMRDKTVWPRLVAVVRDPKAHWDLRAEAVWGLHHFGAPARPILKELLQQPKLSLVECRSTVEGLVRLGGAESVEILRAALKHPKFLVWSEAVEGLGRQGPLSRSALPDLLALLVDEHRNSDARAEIALVIAGGVDPGEDPLYAKPYPGLGLEPTAKSAVPALTAVLDRYDHEEHQGMRLHTQVAVAVARYGEAAKGALPALDRLAALKGKDSWERELKQHAGAAAKAIRKALSDKGSAKPRGR